MNEKKMNLRQKLIEQEKTLKSRLFGMDEIIKIFCLCKAADLTVLMIGPHGIAKSTLARLWSQTTNMSFRIVTSSEVDDALIAYIDPAIFRSENRVQMKRGELMEKDHIFLDEFFLWNNRYRAKLHQLLEERSFSGLDVLTKTYTFATNPLVEHYAGQTEELNFATMDRIDVLLPIYQPAVVATQKMLKKFSEFGRKEPKLDPVISWDDYETIKEEILKVEIPPEIVVWLTLYSEELSCCRYTKDKFSLSKAKLKMFCSECNRKESICARVSCSKPRFIRATSLLIKALTWYRGENSVKFQEVLEAIRYTLPHRLLLSKGDATLLDTEKEIQQIITIFNEQMEMVKNRGIFQKLERIRSKGLDPKKPIFLEQDANDLKLDLQEDLPYLNYSTELIEYSKRRVEKFYRKKASTISPKELESFRDELDASGLDPYTKKDILEKIENQEDDMDE